MSAIAIALVVVFVTVVAAVAVWWIWKRDHLVPNPMCDIVVKQISIIPLAAITSDGNSSTNSLMAIYVDALNGIPSNAVNVSLSNLSGLAVEQQGSVTLSEAEDILDAANFEIVGPILSIDGNYIINTQIAPPGGANPSVTPSVSTFSLSGCATLTGIMS